MGTAETIFEEVVRGGATGSHVTGSDVSHGSHVTERDRNYVLRMPGSAFLLFFFYYSSSIVVQVPWLPEVTEGHVTPFVVPLGVRMRNRSCTISALVGSFHRKCPLWCSLGRPRLSFSSPGYLPTFYFHIIFNNGFHLQCFWLKYLYCDM